MKHKPKISVAMATYNGEQYLAEQLDSIFSQTYPADEVILSDDDSNDGTLKIAEQYRKKYPHLKVLKNQKNIGLNQNFEKTIKETSGEYIAICDQDNVWKKNRLEKLICNIGNHHLIYSDSQLIKEDKRTEIRLSEIKKYFFTNGNTPKEFYFYNSVFGHNVLFKKILIKDILPFPKSNLNYDGWISFVASCVGNIKFFDESLAYFRIHDKNLTSHISKQTDTPTLKEPKWIRRKAYNQKLLDRLMVFSTFDGINYKERLFLESLIREIDLLSDSFFRFPLFFKILWHRHSLFHYKKGYKTIMKAFSQAKGIKWYKFFNA